MGTSRRTAISDSLTIGGIGTHGQTNELRTLLLALEGLAPVVRHTLDADDQLAGDAIGAATEADHTAVTLSSADVGTARRRVHFMGHVYADDDNGADTWRVRVRLGGLTGVLVLDSGAFDLATGEGFTIEGELVIRTVGAGGTFDAWWRGYNEVGAAAVEGVVIGGAIDTTGTVDLVVTGESSSAHADQQVTLRHFEASVWPA